MTQVEPNLQEQIHTLTLRRRGVRHQGAHIRILVPV